eukprot:2905991-Amphidinium_carterae.1
MVVRPGIAMEASLTTVEFHLRLARFQLILATPSRSLLVQADVSYPVVREFETSLKSASVESILLHLPRGTDDVARDRKPSTPASASSPSHGDDLAELRKRVDELQQTLKRQSTPEMFEGMASLHGACAKAHSLSAHRQQRGAFRLLPLDLSSVGRIDPGQLARVATTSRLWAV